jgi:hypothetical protein
MIVADWVWRIIILLVLFNMDSNLARVLGELRRRR